MNKIRALTLKEIENMHGKTVFTTPIVGIPGVEEPYVSFSPLYRGLGFARVDSVDKVIRLDDGGEWNFKNINDFDFGCLVFDREVTEEEANAALADIKNRTKPLALDELNEMDGSEVFTVPIVRALFGEAYPSFNPRYSGLGSHIVKKSERILIDKCNKRWDFDSINNSRYGFIAFKEPVTEEEANKAWEELKLNGMVR